LIYRDVDDNGTENSGVFSVIQMC